jgi:ABC-type sulfate/molybdate transport systems ATPase subunit
MPHTLSGGEARRVSLARAFAIGPRLLFLDEPFSALDLETRAELVGDLRALLRDEGTTALLVTHDHSEAQLLADRSLVLLDGEPAQSGATGDLFARPAAPAVATFLGYAVVARADLPQSIASAVEGETVAVPPSAIRLVDDGPFEASVTAVQGAHGQGRLLLTVGAATLTAAFAIEEISARQLEAGAHVRIAIDSSKLVSWPDTAD